MALTLATCSDKVYRELLGQGKQVSYDAIQSSVPEALMEVSRDAIGTIHQPELETTLSLTLSSADADGLQTATIGATVFEESIIACNDVRMTAVGRFEYRPTVAHLFRLLSTSMVPCFTIAGQTLTARRPSSGLPVTASALKVRAVLILTSIAGAPVGFDHLIVNKLIDMFGGRPIAAGATTG